MNSSNTSLPLIGFYRSLSMPVITSLFLLIQPENLFILLAFALLPNILDFVASLHKNDIRQPEQRQNIWFYEKIPAMHFCLHLLNLVLALQLIEKNDIFTVKVAVCLWLLIQASSLSAPTVGHELIHRKSKIHKWMGRVLLSTIFYEHFFVEHIKGHHKNVGLKSDFSTAHLGESFVSFMQRSVPGQFSNALIIEKNRIRKKNKLMRAMTNTVYQGVAMEIALVCVAYFIAGLPGMIIYIIHGVIVYILSQTFNYLLHWGLERKAGDGPTSAHLSWDCNDQNILYTMLSITRHSFHHAHPNKAFHAIKYIDESPKIPQNLVTIFWLILFRNEHFQKIMTEKLISENIINISHDPEKTLAYVDP